MYYIAPIYRQFINRRVYYVLPVLKSHVMKNVFACRNIIIYGNIGCVVAYLWVWLLYKHTLRCMLMCGVIFNTIMMHIWRKTFKKDSEIFLGRNYPARHHIFYGYYYFPMDLTWDIIATMRRRYAILLCSVLVRNKLTNQIGIVHFGTPNCHGC